MEHGIAVTALGALAHGNRLAVVRLLLEHVPAGLPAGAIGERLGLAPATLSFHLKELSRTGLVAYLTENCCRAQAKSACCGPITPKPRIVARTRLENLA